MSILIKGVNVHRGRCYECPCLDREYGDCNALKKDVHYITKEDCPIIEIPDHGDLADNMSTVDAVERGKWETVDGEKPRRYGCSVCKRLAWYQHNYCPNCGARMDGDE